LNDNLVSILLFVVYNMISSSPYFTPANAEAAAGHVMTTHDIYTTFYNGLFGFTGIFNNPIEQFRAVMSTGTGVNDICHRLINNTGLDGALFPGITGNYPNLWIDEPELKRAIDQLNTHPVTFWRELSKSAETKIKKFVKIDHMVHNGWIFTSPAGNLLHLAPDPTPSPSAVKKTQRQVDDFIRTGYTFIRGPVANTFVNKAETGKLRQNVESTSTGHFNTPEQCNKVIGTQDVDQRCSICGRQREYPSETFSCEHSLEVLLLAICCSLTPSIGNDTILENIYEFLKAINAYTWCCLRCNELKAKIQKSTGVFIGVGADTSGKIIFGRDEHAIGQYIPHLSTWESHIFPGTRPYYFNQPHGSTVLTTDTRDRIYGIIDPLIFALNNIYITSIWGTFQNMMLFGIIKIIAMMGRIYCYPRSTESSGGGRVMNNLTNPKIKYNMKGGVVNIEESVTLITEKGGIDNILQMINYYTLNCTLLTHFDELVNIVIKLQRWVRRARERINSREITGNDESFYKSDYSNSSPEGIVHVIKTVKSKIIEKLQMYIHTIQTKVLTEDERDEIINFIKSSDEDEQIIIIQEMIHSDIPFKYLSDLFSGELNLEQILEEEEDEEYQPVQQVVVDPYQANQANTAIHQLIHQQQEIQQEINSHQRDFFTTSSQKARQSLTDKNSELQAIVVQQSDIIKKLDPAIAAQILTGIPPRITAQILTGIHPRITAQILTGIHPNITRQIGQFLNSSYIDDLQLYSVSRGGTCKRKTQRRKTIKRKSKRRRNNKKRSRK
jgi:flagellar motility protein MotE (MotC chaperone)